MKRTVNLFCAFVCLMLILAAGCDNDALTEGGAAPDGGPQLETERQLSITTQEEASGEESHDSDDPYVIVEVMPSLVGGWQAVADDVVYPESAKNAGIEGRVIITFIVDEEGIPTDITVARSVDEALDQAAIEAVSKQRFTPGMQDGVPVRVSLSLPVMFKQSP